MSICIGAALPRRINQQQHHRCRTTDWQAGMDPLSRRRRRRRSAGVALAWVAATVVLPLLVGMPGVAAFSPVYYSAGFKIRGALLCSDVRWRGKQSGLQRRDSAPHTHSSMGSATLATAGGRTCNDLNDRIPAVFRDQSRSWDNALQEALGLLDPAENALMEGNAAADLAGDPVPNHATYTILLRALAGLSEREIRSQRRCSSSNMTVVDHVEAIFRRLQRVAHRFPGSASPFTPPTRVDYNAVLLTWSKTYRREAAQRCEQLLTELWSQYNATSNNNNNNNTAADSETTTITNKAEENENESSTNGIHNPYCPSHATYVSTLTALARSGTGRHGAERAEALLEDMERLSSRRPAEFSHLRPTTVCVNIVLNAWSKSGARDAHTRCEIILQRLEDLFAAGRTEFQPDTVSYNTVIASMAQSKEGGVEQRAEELLRRMEEPDQFTFNTILNCWARSRAPQAAQRADTILRHWEQRYANGDTALQPDVLAYNTVLTAWARSRKTDTTVKNVQQLLARMEKAYRRGNTKAGPNTISYNVLISALTNLNDREAADHALEILEKMKKLQGEGRTNCRPDTVTYTSIINVVAKKMVGRNATEAAEKVISLLDELEDSYRETRDPVLKPNIRTYTAAIHAIARSRTRPERAEAIMERIETRYASGDKDVQPDCVCYDALINAFGWSDVKGKSVKCYEIYQTMMELYKSRTNVLARPDIITCNSVLNACAFDHADSDDERASILNIVARTLEEFQSSAPKFGWPNHLSYAFALNAIEKHVLDPQKRADMAEAIFWHCCRSGHVSVLVVTSLHRTLSWKRFAELLGDALSSSAEEKLHFNYRRLPKEWTRFAPQSNERRDSRPSKKQFSRSQNARPSMLR